MRSFSLQPEELTDAMLNDLTVARRFLRQAETAGRIVCEGDATWEDDDPDDIRQMARDIRDLMQLERAAERGHIH